jgi:hypothetical protein
MPDISIMQAMVAIQMRSGMTRPFHIRISHVKSRHDGIGSDPDEGVDVEPKRRIAVVGLIDPCGSMSMEGYMPIILWLLGVPLVVVVALMLTHVI